MATRRRGPTARLRRRAGGAARGGDAGRPGRRAGGVHGGHHRRERDTRCPPDLATCGGMTQRRRDGRRQLGGRQAVSPAGRYLASRPAEPTCTRTCSTPASRPGWTGSRRIPARGWRPRSRRASGSGVGVPSGSKASCGAQWWRRPPGSHCRPTPRRGWPGSPSWWPRRSPTPRRRPRCEPRGRGIIAAADATRRQIERELHTGAQQRLVTLALQLRAAGGRAIQRNGADHPAGPGGRRADRGAGGTARVHPRHPSGHPGRRRPGPRHCGRWPGAAPSGWPDTPVQGRLPRPGRGVHLYRGV